MPEQQTLSIQQSIGLGLQHHNAGDLPKAKSIYQRILQSEPNHPIALHLLGVIAHQAGKNDVAVGLITKAIAIAPDYADAHTSLGNALKEQGKLDDAVASYHKTLAIKPDFAEAHSNLGNALQEQGKLDNAVASYHKALAIKPNLAGTHYNLGNTLKEQGKMDDAVASYHKALAIKPDFAEAHSNLGLLLHEQGKLDDAVGRYRKALAINVDYADAHNNLGNVLQELGKMDDAFIYHRRAITLSPQNNIFWGNLAQSIRTRSFTAADKALCHDLLNLLDRPTVRPSESVRPIMSALSHLPDFARTLELVEVTEPDGHVPYQQTAKQFSRIPLFLRILSIAPIDNLKIEKLLTRLRRSMLQETLAGKTEEDGLRFASALALQCFTNEYAYSETDEEKLAVERLQQQIADLVKQTQDVPPPLIATLGAYRPLYTFAWAHELTNRKWRTHISEVIVRQISEPLLELSLRPQITCITPIEDTISQSVRDQYEENPYPRWINTGLAEKGRPIATVLRGLHIDLDDYHSPECPEILVAGCGTGQQALNTASRFKDAHVLAVDLSVSSLCYALRKTDELGISNIEYAQADIMELGILDRQFDLIESVGVLHHLGDPLAGWQVLVNLLKPGGLMKIGLYGEVTRQDIIAGRSLIAEKGYASTLNGIQHCRQDIISRAEDGDPMMVRILGRRDFFSLSNCRDLLFHVQEHRFTLPQIEVALKSLKLGFLGFDWPKRGPEMNKFTETYPRARDRTSLSLWHKFEVANPNAVAYVFWCRKM